MSEVRCPECGEALREVRRDGSRVTYEHDCQEQPRKDAALAPGTAQGQRRYG